MKDKELTSEEQETFRKLSKVFMNTIDNLLLEMDQQRLLLKKLKRTNEYSSIIKIF